MGLNGLECNGFIGNVAQSVAKAIAKVFSTLGKTYVTSIGVDLCSFDYSYNNVIPSGLLFTRTPTSKMIVVEKHTITSQGEKLY